MQEKVRESMGKEEKIKAIEAKLPYIPQETVLDILLRLPVKSLLQFRAVCKQWCSLILDPKFVKMHLHRTNEGNNINLWRLGNIKSSRKPPSVSLYSRNVEASDRKVLELLFEKTHVSHAQVLCSCNGLVLIDIKGRREILFLWNPSTGKYKKFLGHHLFGDSEYKIWGLGYDSSSDDYKVVRAVRFLSPPGSPPHDGYDQDTTHVGFFTLKTDSWTYFDFDEFPYKINYNGQGTVVNGAPHWVVSRDNGFNYFPMIRVVIYFDLKEEKFKEVPSPTWLDENLKFDLGVLGGCLCIAHNHQGSYFEVWAMKEYGVQESWTKLFVIPHSFKDLVPLCFTKKGEVLMEVNRKKFVVYNLKENTYTTILSEDNKQRFQVVTYVESLVSPIVENGTKARTKHTAHGKRKIDNGYIYDRYNYLFLASSHACGYIYNALILSSQSLQQ